MSRVSDSHEYTMDVGVADREDHITLETTPQYINPKVLEVGKQPNSRLKDLPPSQSQTGDLNAFTSSQAAGRPEGCNGRKRTFSETDPCDRNDDPLLPLSDSSPSDPQPRKRPTLRQLSPDPLSNGDTFDNPIDLAADTDNESTEVSQYHPLESFQPDKAKKRNAKRPNCKFLTDENGQMWRYVRMTVGKDGRLRRRYVKHRMPNFGRSGVGRA